MFVRRVLTALACCMTVTHAWAQEAGRADGVGILERPLKSGDSKWVDFVPRYAHAYKETVVGRRFTWIVLTEKAPPLKAWAAAKDGIDARRLWCEREKTPFVAVRVDAKWKVNLYASCPANGGLNTEMLSRWNGMESVVLDFDVREGKRLKGSMRTGRGSCPADDKGGEKYCTPTGRFTFDTPISG